MRPRTVCRLCRIRYGSGLPLRNSGLPVDTENLTPLTQADLARKGMAIGAELARDGRRLRGFSGAARQSESALNTAAVVGKLDSEPLGSIVDTAGMLRRTEQMGSPSSEGER